MQIIEFLALLSGLVAVYFNTRTNVLGWPLGIVSVLLSGIVFYDARLYSDLLLQMVYFLLGFYGWYVWLYGGKNNTVLPVGRLSGPLWVVLTIAGMVGTGTLGFLFDKYTDADLAYWDAFTTSFGLVGQYMLAKKKIENWLVWLVVDACAAGIYFYKELYMLSLLYFLYLGLAAYGWLNWRKIWLQNQTA